MVVVVVVVGVAVVVVVAVVLVLVLDLVPALVRVVTVAVAGLMGASWTNGRRAMPQSSAVTERLLG